MMHVETYPPEQPPERNPAIESFIHWRNNLEQMRSSKHWEGMAIMHWLNHMGQFRSELAPWEWIWCPDCGGRGMWVDGGNHWCPRCSGTRILLAEELTDPAEIALVRRTAPPPDWGRLWSRVERRPVPELKVEGEP
jgi:hypothetical protein